MLMPVWYVARLEWGRKSDHCWETEKNAKKVPEI